MHLLTLPPALRRLAFTHTTFHPQLTRLLTTEPTPTTSPLHTHPPTFPTTPPAPEKEEETTPLLTLAPSTLNSYNTTPPPTPPQLKFASTYFRASAPTFLFSAAHFRSLPPSPHPEVAFLGRSNVGKSSLLNALFGRTNAKPARVSSRPGRTKTMNGFGISGGAEMGAAPKVHSAAGAAVAKEEVWKRFSAGGVVVVDMPGYGSGSREEWGAEALKFLERRRQLRRTFLLVDAEHGLKGTDLQLLVHLARRGVAFTIVLSKVDKVLWTQGGKKEPGRMALDARLRKLRGIMEEMRQRVDVEVGGGNGRRYVGDILCCSAEKMLGKQQHDKLGVDEIRWAVLSACGMECDERGKMARRRMEDIQVLEEAYQPF